MIRKCLAVLLALVMSLMIPLGALADDQHTFTIIPGDVFASEEAICDLLNVLSFTLTTAEESGALSIGVGGENVLTFAMKTDTTGLYVHSNILSDDVLYITWEDAIAIVTQLMAAELNEEEAQAVQQTLEQMQQGMLEPFNQPSAAAVSPEEGLKQAKEMYADDPGMIAYIERIYSKMTTEMGEFTSPYRDTATMKQTIVMTNEDMLMVCDTNMMRSTIEQTVLAEYPNLKGEELAEAVEEVLDETREVFRSMEMTVTVTAYFADDGMTLVGMEMDFPMSMRESTSNLDGESVGGKASEQISMTMFYNRLTDPNGVSYKAGMTMNENGSNLAEVAFDLYRGADGVSKGSLAMLVEGKEITVTYNAANAGTVRTRRADLYVRTGASAIIEPAASDRPLISFQVVSQPADPALLADIEKADSSSAVNLLKLSEKELESLLTDIEARAMQILFAAMGNLPPSVIMMLTNSVQ